MPTVHQSLSTKHSAGGRNVYMVEKFKASDQYIMTIKWNQNNVLFGGYVNQNMLLLDLENNNL